MLPRSSLFRSRVRPGSIVQHPTDATFLITVVACPRSIIATISSGGTADARILCSAENNYPKITKKKKIDFASSVYIRTSPVSIIIDHVCPSWYYTAIFSRGFNGEFWCYTAAVVYLSVVIIIISSCVVRLCYCTSQKRTNCEKEYRFTFIVMIFMFSYLCANVGKNYICDIVK